MKLSEQSIKKLADNQEILFYKDGNNEVKIEVLLKDENLWLTQTKMAELFDVQKPAISKHLKNIFAEGELEENSVVSILETTATKRSKTQLFEIFEWCNGTEIPNFLQIMKNSHHWSENCPGQSFYCFYTHFCIKLSIKAI